MPLHASVAPLVLRELSKPSTILALLSRQEAITCGTGNEYDGRMNVRISAIFVILVTSALSATFPVFANRSSKLQIPSWVFFGTKFFGSGVIVATAFIHLLSPAADALRDPCLTGPITEYDWVSGIALMTIFVLAFIELMAMRFGMRLHQRNESTGVIRDGNLGKTEAVSSALNHRDTPDAHEDPRLEDDDHQIELGHSKKDVRSGDYISQITAIFILEFGVIFHSIFIGLTLAVAGEEFNTLYPVVVFHQTFEGLGLGSILAVTPWPKAKGWTPYVLGIAYSFATPISIAVGLGLRNTYPPGSQTTLIVNGVFDSISAGILIYTGLVELIAREFMFSKSMREANLIVVLSAFGTMSLGAGLMAMLGKWA